MATTSRHALGHSISNHERNNLRGYDLAPDSAPNVNHVNHHLRFLLREWLQPERLSNEERMRFTEEALHYGPDSRLPDVDEPKNGPGGFLP